MTQHYRKLNSFFGIAVGLVAAVVYGCTAEAAGSFWDCGEFISCAYKVQNAHPPGNTFFAVVGRFFIVLWGDSPHTAARAVNFLSAFSAAAAIMFLFWIMTFFVRKFVLKHYPVQPWKNAHEHIIFSVAAVGSLSAIFVDSFWFSAVEGEVYALAACLLLAIVWLMTKWEMRAHLSNADRYIVLIFLLIGLSTGVHLLDLLVIPVLTMMYYFKRFEKNITNKGIILAFVVGCALTGFVMTAVLAKTISWAAAVDRFFVNALSLPVYSGFVVFICILFGLAVCGVLYGKKRRYYFLELASYCYVMVLLGYSVYVLSIERSEAKVPINMGDPDNPMALKSYISRAQYGDKPLLYGQVFTAGNALGRETDEYRPTYKDGEPTWALVTDANGKKEYIVAEREYQEIFHPDDMMLFPRVWNNKNDGRGTQDFYANWLGINKVRSPQTDREVYERPPNFIDNLRWFFSYQIGWMYARYLMWNFVGRQNDIQGLGNVRDANVITGIDALDNIFLGDQTKLPTTLRQHKSRNTMFAIPFLLGILGLVFHAKKDKNGFVTVLVFFFFTGLAIMLYLNDAGPQPRERDYASAVSFLVFCLWIGFGILYLFDRLHKKYLRSAPAFFSFIAASALICPALMAAQEWDDHDRSKKTLARDYAKCILSSCDKNAVLFTAGDNDTYPLWYVQEVEGYRTDVRVVNTSLLGIDWYIRQLRYKQNRSDSFDVIFTQQQITGSNRNYLPVHVPSNVGEKDFFDLRDEVLRHFVAVDSMRASTQDGTKLSYFPTRNFAVPIDRVGVVRSGLYPAGDTARLPSHLLFSLPKAKSYVRKDELIILSLLATSGWTRPLNFIDNYQDLGFGQYLQKQGMIYRLTPVANSGMNTDVSARLALDSFSSGGLQYAPVYVDETNRMQVLAIRNAYADIANGLVDVGRLEDARKVLYRESELFPSHHVPYGMASRYGMHNSSSLRLMQAAARCQDTPTYNTIRQGLLQDMNEQSAYYDALAETKRNGLYWDVERNKQMLGYLKELDKDNEGMIRASLDNNVTAK